MNIDRRSNTTLWRVALLLVCACGVGAAWADPPDRVARLGYVQGNVSFQPAGENQWVEAQLNRPLTTGDQLYTDRDSRAELGFGDATLRLDSNTTFTLLDLDDATAQIELTQGVLNLEVHHVFEGQSYEIDTPTLAFVVSREGEYRIDIAPNGDSTMVTVFDGGGDVYGENNASYSVDAGHAYRFHDSALRDYEVLDLPRANDFDSWCDAREQRYQQSPSRRYVSNDVIGYQDLDNYGTWDSVDTYGSVWFPTRVDAGWAPYSSGHWVWIDPWGWSWIDSAPWGFAPFHYGRWAYVRNRWGWIPGPRDVRAIYAPALVGFVGGSGFSVGLSVGGGGPVGWFPLGPRDVYVPWYHGSRNYFRDINVRNTTVINNINITNIYNNYSNGRPIRNVSYAYRNDVRAVTAVPRAAFVGGRSVRSQRIQVNQAELSRSHAAGRMAIAPIAASAVAANATRARAVPQRAVLDRRIIARRAPPARLAPMSARVKAIEHNGGRPLVATKARTISPTRAAGAKAAPQRVRVVGQGRASPKPLPVRNRMTPRTVGGPPTRGAVAPRGKGTGATSRSSPPNQRAVTGRAPANESNGPKARPNLRTLPSARFVPHRGGAASTAPAPTTRAKPVERPVPIERAKPAQRPAPVTPSPTREDKSRTSGERALPSSRFVPQRGGAASTAPASRAKPVERADRRAEPAQLPVPIERAAPPTRRTPAERARPRQQSAPVQRPVPIERAAPPTRRAPVERAQPRPEPPQRAQPYRAPVQREQQHGAPVQRAAPVRRAEPAQRRAPAERPPSQRRKVEKKDDNKDDNDHGHH